jgi:hypothetical protein
VRGLLGACETSTPLSLTLEVSEDGKTYTKVWQDTSKAQSFPEVWTIPLKTYKTGGDIPGKTLRYLRFSLPGKNRVLHLKSVQVYGK